MHEIKKQARKEHKEFQENEKRLAREEAQMRMEENKMNSKQMTKEVTRIWKEYNAGKISVEQRKEQLKVVLPGR